MTDAQFIEQQAALWLVRRDDPQWSDDLQIELDAWLAQSFAHKAAFWRLEAGNAKLGRLASLGASGELRPDSTLTTTGQPRLGRRYFSAMARIAEPLPIAAGLAAVLFASWFMLTQSNVPDHMSSHVTRSGQTGSLQLADGSGVELNTNTGIRIGQFDKKRSIWIDRGEAYFDVAKDKARPFVVHAGLGDVTVLGTKFAIHRNGEQLTVSVLEGRVMVSSGQPGTRSTIITAGDILSTDGRTAHISTGELDQVRNSLSWRQGMIVFDDETLANVAGQFNRYNSRKIVVTGSATENLRISGSFRLGNIEGFSQLMEHAYGLRTSRSEKEIRISTR